MVAGIGSSRCLTRYFAVPVERRGVGETAIFANHLHCDGRYSLPHPFVRFSQTSLTYSLSDPSGLRRAAPSVPLNGQSQSLLSCSSSPYSRTNPLPPSPPTHYTTMDLDSLDPVALARHERKEKGRLARLQNVLPSKVQAAPPTPAPTSSVGDSRTPKRFKYEEANALKQKAKQAVIGLLVGKGKVSALGVKRARAVKRRAQARRGDERLAVKQVTALRLSPCDRMTHRVTYMPFASTRTCPLRAHVHAVCSHT